MTSTEPTSDKASTFDFHPRFSTKEPGDIILQSDCKKAQCFYFPLSLLSATSSFFSGLPPPSSTDLVNGVALIPLSDTPRGGLCVALSAVRAINRAEPFILPHPDHGAGFAYVDVINAALWAKRYDIPVIYRMLQEGLSPLRTELKTFLVWAVWCIAGIESEICVAAQATRGYDITRVPKPIVLAIRQNILDHWTQLQDLHLRYTLGPGRFHESVANEDSDGACDDCLAKGIDHTYRIIKRFWEAKTVEGILRVPDGDYGLDCGEYAENLGENYKRLLDWFKDYTSSYRFKGDVEEYE